MSVSDTNKIDLVSDDPSNNTVVLSIVEERNWGQSGELLPDLQKKIKSYLAYALDGQLLREYPDMVGKRIKFRLYYDFEPGPLETQFIEIAKQQWFSPDGIEWEQRQLSLAQPPPAPRTRSPERRREP